MHCADAVLSGGVRRSATSVIFDKDDTEMINAKTYFKVDKIYSFHPLEEKEIGGFKQKLYEGTIKFEGEKYDLILNEWDLDKLQKEQLISWNYVQPQRGRSNNSILLLRNKTTFEEFKAIFERTKQFGEPGFVFGNHPWQLFNPCFEIGFIPVTTDGVCGVQFCNLTTSNGRYITSIEKFKECVEAMTIIGTLQAGYTEFSYLNHVSETLTREESLLGCSITGMLENPDILLNPEIQKQMAELAIKINKEWAGKIFINPASRITCVKPEGTSSLVLGTGSGIHAHHARKYIRRVQNNKLDNVYKHFKKNNPELCEHSVWSANHTDDVINFPIEISDKAIVKKDLSALKHLEIIKSTQKNWVLTGTTESNKKPIEHNVSCTVIVKNNEWDDVIKFLYENRDLFAAVSLLPETGDKDYLQAPMEEIVTEEDEIKFEKLVKNFKHVNYKELKEDEDNTKLTQEGACFGGSCEVIKG